MPLIYDKAYIFSVSKRFFGRIVAYCGDSCKSVAGKDVFEYLGLGEDDECALREVLAAYGKDGYATAGYNGRWHPVFFFKDFAYDTGLCLAVVPAVSARIAAEAISNGFIEGFSSSERLLSLAKIKNDRSITDDSMRFMHLSRVLGQIMQTTALKLDHSSASAESIRFAAEGIASFAMINLDFDTYLSIQDEALVFQDEIFDGRFCSAAIVILAMLASRCSADGSLKLTVVRGVGEIALELSFKKRFGGWQGPLNFLKDAANINHGIMFYTVEDQQVITVGFIPFYQDVGFVGVKFGEELFDLAEQRELF